MSQHEEHHRNAVKGSEVFVGGLPQTITENKLREIFSPCGEMVEIRLIKDQKGSMKGYCFVRFATKEAAEKAIKEKNGLLLNGKKIGVLRSIEQDTLYFGNLNKGWSAPEFEGTVRQVFTDIVSIDLPIPLSSGEMKQRNRGFAFVKFSSHAAAARAHRVGSKPDFVIGGTLHPTIQWAAEEPEVDPTVLAKIKIAFIRNLPANADEHYVKQLFESFGMIEKVVLWSKGSPPVGFVHFTKRSDLDNAIKGMHEKIVQGPNGGPSYKLSVEVARPMDKTKKRTREESESKVQNKIPSHLPEKSPIVYSSVPAALGPTHHAHKEQEYGDPYEVAVLALPTNVKERLLRILRLSIATRFDIDIQILNSLKELPESTALAILDQFMLSGGDSIDKRNYLAGLISTHEVDKMRSNRFAGSLSRVAADIATRDSGRDSGLYSFSNRVNIDSTLPSFTVRRNLSAVNPVASTSGLPFSRPDGYISRYSSLFPDSPPPPVSSTPESIGRMKEMKFSPLWATSSSSLPYDRLKLSPEKISTLMEFRSSRPLVEPVVSPPPQFAAAAAAASASVEREPTATTTTRPQMKFDPFTGEPYKFDPFTGERILPDNLPH